MELEKELVRALRPLALGEVPAAAITSLFDTGGTAAVREEWAENATRRQLRALDKVLGRYLRRPAEDEQVARLWTFFASQEAIEAVTGAQEQQDAVYRSLLALLQAVFNVRDVYASLDEAEKKRELLRALVAAKVYLVWLQLPGGAAYGLFMSYVYRQVLDVVKKWVVLLAAKGQGAAPKKTGRRGKRRAVRKEQSSDEEDEHVSVQMLTQYGLELLEMLVAFLGNFSLSASKESIVPTIETAIALQTALPPEDGGTASVMTDKTVEMLEALVSGTHGEPLQIGRAIIHCYIPGVTFQDTVAKENRSSLRFHKLAIDIISRIQQTTANACEVDDAEGTALRDNSLLLLGLLQNICLQAPGLADERQRVLSYVFSTAMAGRQGGELEGVEKANAFRDEECVRFARFLASYSRNAKLKYRQFAVELISRFVVETGFWKAKEDEISPVLVAYSGVGPLLEVLIDRARDKMSQVRTKAIGGISAMLTLGLSNLATSSADSDDDEDMNASSGPEAIALSLQKLLYEPSIDAEGHNILDETPLMQRLVDLSRERLVDEKTFVRRAAVHALEALLTAHSGDSVHPSSRKDLFDIHARCTDSSIVVRVQAIKSLSAIVLKFPRDEEAQKLWNLGVLPLCFDPETTVQSCALEAAGRVVFDRVLVWYDARRNDSQREVLDCVWMLVSHLDGVMARCLQKAMRMLIKSDKIDVRKIVKACVFAIQESVSLYNSGEQVQEEEEDEDTRRALARYWGFSWIVLEELAHSGNLIDAVRDKQQNLSIVVECWNKLQAQALPVEFNDGSKRILRVIAAISTVIDAQDAKSIADGILASLHSFAIPLNVIADGVLALNSICKAKAPSSDKSREISFAWGKKLLELCESSLRKCFESSPDNVAEETSLLQKQLISIGEVSLLEFDKDADKSGEAALLPVSSSLKSLVQLFLPPKFVPNSNAINQSMSQAIGQSEEEEEQTATFMSAPVPLPTPVRVCAFVTLGKLCLRDQDLAKKCMTMFIRELRTCPEQDIRSNILLILGDLCIRYTSLVDAYVPTIALSLLDESRLLRRSALLLFSQLILQDYIKWRESLLRFFLRAAVDVDEELANLARHVLCGPLLQKSPHIFTNKFIEMIFVFNGFEGDKLKFSEPFEKEGTRELALLGNARYPRRARLYNFLLEHMTDEQKLQISMKLCNEVLEEVMDGKLPLCDNPSQITDHCTEAVLKDTFAILCSPEIKLTTTKDDDDEADGDDVGTAANGNVASQIAAAKGRLLSKMSKKNFLENVVPVLIGLKHTLEAKHSPLTRYLLHYIRELFKLYRQEVKDIFMDTDPQMAMEVEYDLRQYDLQQQQSRRSTYAPTNATSAPLSPLSQVRANGGANEARQPQTPQEKILEASNTPLRLRSDEKSTPAGRRRRQSLPATPTPAHSGERPREVSSEEARRETSEGSTLIFSPSQGRPAGDNGGWHVTAQSPSVEKPRGRGKKGFSQKDLEGRMRKDLAEAFDSADDSDEKENFPTVTRRKKNNKGSKAAHKASPKDEDAYKDEAGNEEEEENGEEVAPQPLKKKKKTKGAKKPAAAKSPRSKRKRK